MSSRRGLRWACLCTLAMAGVYTPAAHAARSFELVTPTGDTPLPAKFAKMTPDGDHVLWQSTASVAGAAPDGASDDVFESERGASAWEVQLRTPGLNGMPISQSFQVAAADLSRLVTGSGSSLVPQDGDAGASQLNPDYVSGKFDLYEPVGDNVELLSAGSLPATAAADATLVGMSPDGSYVVWTTAEKQEPTDTDPNAVDVYERTGTTTTLVSNGPTDPQNAVNATVVATMPLGGPTTRSNEVTDDGRVFFTTAAPLVAQDNDASVDVYAGDGTTTTLISGTHNSSASGPVVAAASFAGATPDGSEVVFATTEKITDDDTDAGIDLYAYRNGTVTRISQGPTGGNSTAPGMDATYLAMNGAGDVLFSTKEVLTSDDADAAASLYLWDGATVHYIATLPELTAVNCPTTTTGACRALRSLHISDDGTTVELLTSAALTSYDTDTTVDVYRWHSGQLTLLTPHTVFDVTVGLERTAADQYDTNGGLGNNHTGRYVLADGTVLFSSAERLTAADQDDGIDVYAADVDGKATLVTPGDDGGNDDLFLDATADGKTVLFAAKASLSPRDTDGGEFDIYAARADGFPAEAAPVLETSDGEGGGLLDRAAPATSRPSAGNLTPTRASTSAFSFRSGGLALRGSSLRLTVQVPGAGRLVVRGSRVAKATGSPRRKGAFTLTLRMTKAARAALRRHHRVRITVRVTYTPSGGNARTRSLTATVRSTHRGR